MEVGTKVGKVEIKVGKVKVGKVEMKVGKGGMKVWTKVEDEGEGGERVDRVSAV